MIFDFHSVVIGVFVSVSLSLGTNHHIRKAEEEGISISTSNLFQVQVAIL